VAARAPRADVEAAPAEAPPKAAAAAGAAKTGKAASAVGDSAPPHSVKAAPATGAVASRSGASGAAGAGSAGSSASGPAASAVAVRDKAVTDAAAGAESLLEEEVETPALSMKDMLRSHLLSATTVADEIDALRQERFDKRKAVMEATKKLKQANEWSSVAGQHEDIPALHDHESMAMIAPPKERPCGACRHEKQHGWT